MFLKGAFICLFTQQHDKSLLVKILAKKKVSIIISSCAILLCYPVALSCCAILYAQSVQTNKIVFTSHFAQYF